MRCVELIVALNGLLGLWCRVLVAVGLGVAFGLCWLLGVEFMLGRRFVGGSLGSSSGDFGCVGHLYYYNCSTVYMYDQKVLHPPIAQGRFCRLFSCFRRRSSVPLVFRKTLVIMNSRV